MVQQTYTQENIDRARSVFGDDPSAVARGVAQTMTQSPTFQAPIQGQAGAIDKLQQIREYDKQLAGQATQGNQAQMQAGQAQTQQLAQYGALGATPQETIAKAQGALPETQMREPTVGFLSPFVASGLATGASNAATDTYDIAAQSRAALTKAVGSEAEAYASAIEYGNKLKEIEDARKQQEYQNAIDLAKITGVFTDPFTKETTNVSTGTGTATEREFSRITSQLEEDAKNGVPIEDILTRYKDSLDYNDILKIYNDSSPYGEAKKGDDFYRKIYEGTATSGEFNPQDLVSKTTIGKTGEVAGFLKDLQDIKNLLGESDGYVSDLGVGKTGFLSQFAGARGKYGNVRSAIDSLRAKVKKKTYGAAVSEQEMKDAEKWLPGTGSQESVNVTKINSIIDSKKNEVASLLRAEGLSEDQISTYFNQLGIDGQSDQATQSTGSDPLGLGI